MMMLIDGAEELTSIQLDLSTWLKKVDENCLLDMW
jgi:hypothetical protein